MEALTIKRKISKKERKEILDKINELERQLEEKKEQIKILDISIAKDELKIKIKEDMLKNPLYIII